MGEGHNPLCGDRVKVYLHVGDGDDRIADISFEGKGCAISQASASMMTDMRQGPHGGGSGKADGRIPASRQRRGCQRDIGPDDREHLDVMAGVSAFPMRVKCATLAWHTMKSALEGGATAKSE